MRSFLYFVIITWSSLSFNQASALQCLDILGSHSTNINSPIDKTYDKVLKTFLMVNLIYPQNDAGVFYALTGLLLSGQATYAEIRASLYDAPADKLEALYKAMQNAHAAHGVASNIPFSRIIEFTKQIELKADFIFMSSLASLFPEYTPSSESVSEVVAELSLLLADNENPQSVRAKAYGELIIASLRDKDAMEYAKHFRSNYRDGRQNRYEQFICKGEICAYLKDLIKNKLEEKFPETKNDVGPMYDGQMRPLSEAIGGFF